jgi:hypothetical protein
MSREKIKNVIGKDHKTLLIDSKNWIKKLAWKMVHYQGLTTKYLIVRSKDVMGEAQITV